MKLKNILLTKYEENPTITNKYNLSFFIMYLDIKEHKKGKLTQNPYNSKTGPKVVPCRRCQASQEN